MKIPTTITRFGGKIVLFGKRHAPEILLAAGVVSTIAGTVVACKATLKVDDILDEHKDTMIRIKNKYEKSEKGETDKPYTKRDKQEDTVKMYAVTAGRMIKNYAPAAGLTIGGIGCMLGACGIYRSWYFGAVALYTELDTKFKEYRGRVIEDRGETKDLEYMYGLKAEEIATTKEGCDEPVVETVLTVPEEKSFDEYVKEHGHSPYARIFDSTNPNWNNNPIYNRKWLEGQETFLNNQLQTRGYLFLDEVLTHLGWPATKASKQVGWLKDRGDGFVSLNIIQPYNSRFVNGYEPSCIVDFNVDGIILNDAPMENI